VLTKLENFNMKINLIGLGKLGYPMSLFLSSAGYKINCFDINSSIYEKIKGDNYLSHEENISDFAEYNNNLFYFDSIQSSFAETDISFITVPTPSNIDGSFSLDIVKLILDELGIYLKNNNNKKKNPYLINICSTINPYSCDHELIPYLENKYNLKEGVDFVFIYNPYFVALGSVVKTLLNPDFVLIGTRNKDKINNLLNVYNAIYSKDVKFKFLSLKEAEITKIFVNTYLTLKISFSNYVQLLSYEDNELSASKILDAIGEDKRIGKAFLQPGFPYGGPCLPRDNNAAINFLNKLEVEGTLNKSADSVNNYFILTLYEQIKYLLENNIKNISFIGYGYRANTDCTEGSVALKLIDFCLENNFKVLLYDFYIKESYKNLKKYTNFEEFLLHSDIIFMPYKDKKFNKLLNFNKKRIIILDCFNQFNNSNNNIKITNNLRNIELDFIKEEYTKKDDNKVIHIKK
jgi:UDPglucose 6-dehydrogenase